MHPDYAINFRSMEARRKQHSNSVGTKCFHILQSDKSNSEKGPSRSVKVEKLIIVTPTWQAQPWYPLLLEMSM